MPPMRPSRPSIRSSPAFEPSARIDTEGVRPRAPLPGNPPAKRVADVAPVFGGAAAEGVQAAFEPASLDPDATVRMEAISD